MTFVQRFGGALNLNVHFHTLVLDGAYTRDEAGRARFHALPLPDDAEVARVTGRVARRILALLERRGLAPKGMSPRLCAWSAHCSSPQSRVVVCADPDWILATILAHGLTAESWDAQLTPTRARLSMANETAERLLIPLSKTKIVLVLMGSAVFLAAGLLLWANADQISPPIYVEAVTIAAVGFFGLCGLYALSKLFDRAPGLIVDAEGIMDNSSGVSAGRIPWSDIAGFKITSVQKQRFLTIEVYNAETYVRRANFLKRPLVALNMKYFGSPIQISANTLKIDFDRLVKIVTDSHAKHRQSNTPLQPTAE